MQRRRVVAGGLALAAALTLAGPTVSAGTVTRRVRIDDNFFDPQTRRIDRGDRVRWRNVGNRDHTVTSNTGLFHRRLDPGERFTRTFNQVGTFRYHCRLHDGMTGRIIVG
jgi:plastocyanin